MNWIRSLVDTSIKPLLFINSFNDLTLFFREQITSFRILTGLYTFYVTSDQRTVFSVGDTCLVNITDGGEPVERRAQCNLKQGFYPISVTYFHDHSVNRFLSIAWSSPNKEKRIIARTGII